MKLLTNDTKKTVNSIDLEMTWEKIIDERKVDGYAQDKLVRFHSFSTEPTKANYNFDCYSQLTFLNGKPVYSIAESIDNL